MDGNGYWACVASGPCVRGMAQTIYRPTACGGCPMARYVTGEANGLAKSLKGQPLTPDQQQKLRRLQK